MCGDVCVGNVKLLRACTVSCQVLKLEGAAKNCAIDPPPPLPPTPLPPFNINGSSPYIWGEISLFQNFPSRGGSRRGEGVLLHAFSTKLSEMLATYQGLGQRIF